MQQISFDNNLTEMEDPNSFPTSEITPEFQRLTIQAITLLLIKRGLHNLFPLGKKSKSYNYFPHSPRKSSMIFLEGGHGINMLDLRKIIEISRSEFFSEEHEIFVNENPYHINIERVSLQKHEKIFHGQLSIEEIRKFSNNDNNVAIQLKQILTLFDQILEPKKVSVTQNFMLIRNEIIKSVVFLSDLFSFEQFVWFYKFYKKIYDFSIDNLNDFMLEHYLLIGICKSISVLHKFLESSESLRQDIVYDPLYIRTILLGALEQLSNISLSSAALISLNYLIEAQASDVKKISSKKKKTFYIN